jgi:hypothetical protein
MPRRPGGLIGRLGSTALFTAALVVLAGCQADLGTAGCSFELRSTLPASPLDLMSRARLDRVGAAFALSGLEADGKTVRWRGLDEAGAAGPEQSLALPASASGPWLAFAGDALLIAHGLAAANGTDVELRLIVAPTAGAASTPAAGPVLATIPGALAGAASPGVAIGASRTGGHATLAWYDAQVAGVQAVTVTAAGVGLAAPKVIEPSTPVSCLAFVPGRDAATLSFYRHPNGPSEDPELVIIELDEQGAVTGTLQLLLDARGAGCPQLRATATGYVLAFQDMRGSWLGVYTAATTSLDLTPYASAVGYPGGRQPPLAGLAPVADGYAVVVQGAHGGEVWRLDATGHRRPGSLYLPSVAGSTGEISTWTGPDGIYATYADYTVGDAGTGMEGQRFFVRAACL